MQKSLFPKINISSEFIKTECPVCHFSCSDQEDIDSVKEFNACKMCCLNFMYTMGGSWQEGKRPTLEEARKKMGFDIFITAEN